MFGILVRNLGCEKNFENKYQNFTISITSSASLAVASSRSSILARACIQKVKKLMKIDEKLMKMKIDERSRALYTNKKNKRGNITILIKYKND